MSRSGHTASFTRLWAQAQVLPAFSEPPVLVPLTPRRWRLAAPILSLAISAIHCHFTRRDTGTPVRAPYVIKEKPTALARNSSAATSLEDTSATSILYPCKRPATGELQFCFDPWLFAADLLSTVQLLPLGGDLCKLNPSTNLCSSTLILNKVRNASTSPSRLLGCWHCPSAPDLSGLATSRRPGSRYFSPSHGHARICNVAPIKDRRRKASVRAAGAQPELWKHHRRHQYTAPAALAQGPDAPSNTPRRCRQRSHCQRSRRHATQWC